MTTVNLTLAFLPSKSLVKKLALWFKKNFGSKVVLDIQVDPKILGGAILSFNGYYRDFSLKKKLERKLKNF